MRIGVIGGAERNELQYRRVATEAGHSLEFHSGKLSSCGAASLEALVKRCDLVFIATDTNSHAAVRAARGLMRSRGASPVLVRRLGVSRLASLLRSPPPSARATDVNRQPLHLTDSRCIGGAACSAAGGRGTSA